jgi:hypothetical protein
MARTTAIPARAGEIVFTGMERAVFGRPAAESVAKFRPGDMVTMVFSERSAFEITPVRESTTFTAGEIV